MTKNILPTFILFFTCTFVSAQTRYISVTGVDTSDCSLPGNPCASISYAATEAADGDTIMVASGTYAFTGSQVIDKSLIVMGQDSLNKPVITAAAQDVLQITADSVTVSGLRIEMGLSAANGLRGIVASGNNYTGLIINNNEIISTKPLSFGIVFSSYGILISGGTGLQVTLSNNIIEPLDSVRDAHGRGVGLGLGGASSVNGPGASLSGNTIRAFYPLQAIQFTGDLICNNNIFTGSTAISYPLAGTTTTLTSNIFDGYNDQIASNINALLEVRAFDNNASATIQDNEFTNFLNIGLFSSASRNITVLDNEFSPSSNASNFISLFANTKLFTSGTQNSNYVNQIDIKGNIFNAGMDSTGAAITFADHYGAVSPAFEDTIIVGGPNPLDKNTFDLGYKYFIVLDSSSGPSNALSFWSGYHVSNMLPFSQNVYALAAYNNYGITDTIALEEKMLDSLEISGLGKVILFDSLVVTSYKSYDVLTINAYPNPSQDFISVSNKKLSGLTQVSILDMAGRIVYSIQHNITNNLMCIPVSQLSKGSYVMMMQNNQTLYQSKFVKD
jgi:hypothetical protein